LMGLAFCVCLPFGLASPLIFRTPQLTLVRGGFLFSVIGLAVGVYLVAAVSAPHFRQPHSVLGVILIVAWGIHAFILTCFTMAKRPRLKLMHTCLGVCVLLVGIVDTYLGVLQSSSASVAVWRGTSALILSVWLAIVAFAILYLYCRSKSRVGNGIASQGPIDTPFPGESSNLHTVDLPPTPMQTRTVPTTLPPPLPDAEANELAELLPYEPSPPLKSKKKDSSSPDVQYKRD